jgi:serine/threonine protein kinase
VREAEEFGPYQLVGQLGAGGMGVVYRAIDRRVPRTVALKILHPAMAADPVYRERFRRESAMLSAAEHPHIVPLYNTGEIEHRLFLDMRLIGGDDLQAALDRRGPMPVRRAVAVIDGLADALDFVHQRGVLHRDIKPKNVMLAGARFFPYLLDFGIARADNEASLTQDGAVAGSMDYLAPERFRGEPASRRSDLYSLTGVLMACLTGRAPYVGQCGPLALFHAHAAAEIPRPSSFDPALAPFDAVIGRGMAKDPAARFADAGELAAATAAALDRVPDSQDARSQRWSTGLRTAQAQDQMSTSLAWPATPGWSHPGEAYPAQVAPAEVPAPIWSYTQPPPQDPGAPLWPLLLVPLSAVLAIIATCLPWFHAEIKYNSYTSRASNGLSAWGDGKVGTLVPVLLGATSLVLGQVLRVRRRQTGAGSGALGRSGPAILVVGIGCLFAVGVAWLLLPGSYRPNGESWSDYTTYTVGGHVSRGVQAGYWLALVATLLTLMAGGLMILHYRKRRPPAEANASVRPWDQATFVPGSGPTPPWPPYA